MKMDYQQNKDFEFALLSALLTDTNFLPEVIPLLRPEMFSSSDAAFVYQAICNTYANGIMPDYHTTEIEMEKLNPEHFGRLSGIACLSGTLGMVRDGRNATEYAREVKHRYTLRRLNALFTGSADKASVLQTDCNHLILEVGKEMEEIIRSISSQRPMQSVSDLILKAAAIHHENMLSPVQRGVLFGLNDFDAMTGGILPGELVVMGGRPGDGKTAVALQIAMNAALSGKRTAFITLEMRDIELINRFLTGYAGIDPGAMRISSLTEKDINKMNQLADQWKECPLDIQYCPGISVAELKAELMRVQNTAKYDFVVIDYLQLMDTPVGKNDTLNNAITAIVHELKRTAIRLECGILVLSQLNRNSENRKEAYCRPELVDFRDSGSIEQDADLAFFVFRPDKHGLYKDPESGKCLRNTVQLLIRKNRSGILGDATIRHNTTFTRFTDEEPVFF